jgi:hypothetical protein
MGARVIAYSRLALGDLVCPIGAPHVLWMVVDDDMPGDVVFHSGLEEIVVARGGVPELRIRREMLQVVRRAIYPRSV